MYDFIHAVIRRIINPILKIYDRRAIVWLLNVDEEYLVKINKIIKMEYPMVIFLLFLIFSVALWIRRIDPPINRKV